MKELNPVKPVLSVCIIFKNERRCLERCLNSFQPLREKLPLELVMADTGSDDGSRQIAGRYADVLFDFPWIDDFSAARNAVIERASGQWILSVDCDEWLSEDLSGLLGFFKDAMLRKAHSACGIRIRNFLSEDFKQYNEFIAVRLVRRSPKFRYEGAIHEHWNFQGGDVLGLAKTFLYHDGYVGFSGERGRPKRERNMELLRQSLEKDPDNLLLRLQRFESSVGDDQEKYIRLGVEGVEQKLLAWDRVGPAIYRYAVQVAYERQLPEAETWPDRAAELFPNSLFVRIDISFLTLMKAMNEQDHAVTAAMGARYVKAIEAYRAERYDHAELLYDTLIYITAENENLVRLFLADAYFYQREYQKGRDMLLSVNRALLDAENTGRYAGVMMNYHVQTGQDMSGAFAQLWRELHSADPEKAEENRRKQNAVKAVLLKSFTRQHRDVETASGFRHAYTLFLSLGEQDVLGRAAAMLESVEPEVLTALLGGVERWEELPVAAFAHALEHGAVFPPPGRRMWLEELDMLASGFASQERDSLLRLARKVPEGGDPLALCWNRALTMAAVGAANWTSGDMDLARAFVRTERAFLPLCYSPLALQPEQHFLLPPMHRYGVCCVRAFDALDSGDFLGCVRELHEGLDNCPDMKAMTSFLLEELNRQEKQKRIENTPQELKELANQVRSILMAYPPDDPAVTALKDSPAYQKVAYLIEE